VSHGAIRYYFASREALLLACLQDIEEQRSAEAGLAIAEAEQDGDRAPAEATARRVVRCFAGPDLSDDALRGAMGWLIDTTRESSDLGAELSRERRAIEEQTERLLRAGGFDGVPAELVVALTEGAVLNLVVRHRPAVAVGAVAALVQLVLHPRHRDPTRTP
jgi:AcrR family transcriptional regulator